MPPGGGLMSARPGPDLAAAGYTETEYTVSGTAPSYVADELPTDGCWELAVSGRADFVTRAVLRRPSDPRDFSGTLLAEWLNVSSGADAAPDWTYLAEEIVRRGHAWIGISAQYIGVEGGEAPVDGLGLAALKSDERYAGLHHPGDAFAFGIFTEVVEGLSVAAGDLEVNRRLAIGESQSAYALTSYVNGVHRLAPTFDGFLIHSRGGAAMPLGEPGCGVDLVVFRNGPATRIREDLDVPVIIVQTETDVIGHLNYLPARQPDNDWLRLWEVAGTAHADKFQIGEFEDFLGCPGPVNRGQQAYVRPRRVASSRRLGRKRRAGSGCRSAGRRGRGLREGPGRQQHRRCPYPGRGRTGRGAVRPRRSRRLHDLPLVREHACAGRRPAVVALSRWGGRVSGRLRARHASSHRRGVHPGGGSRRGPGRCPTRVAREEDLMKTRLACPCGTTIVGTDEDDLVTKTQEHLAADHPGREYEREMILFMAT